MKAPYSFIPLSDVVFCPQWSEYIYQDIPQKDAHSGCIDFLIETHSPLFVRNGVAKGSPNEGNDTFSIDESKNKYFIPGSSIKGMIRNVLEILSFSRMNQMDDVKYAFRDFDNPNLYTLLKLEVNQTIRGGWLRVEPESDQENVYIEDCGVPYRISHEKIDAAFGSALVKAFCEGGTKTRGRQIIESYKTAKAKYELIGYDNYTKIYTFSKSEENKKVTFDLNGTIHGRVVVTGQPSVRAKNKKGEIGGKFYEFVFPESDLKEYKLSENQWKDFKFQYKDWDRNKISEDWKFWKQKLKEGEKIPVFFRLEGDKILDLGLTQTYKLPYKNRTKELLPRSHKIMDKLDLACTLFGYVTKNDALKGRVQFSHAFAEEDLKIADKQIGVLGTPQASYYPMYILQDKIANNCVSEYNTYMNDDARLAGWKRYPVHTSKVKPLSRGNDNENLLSHFTPVCEGSLFKGKLRYHNLNRVELGALFSAITFHNNSQCYHNIGLAKGYGFGKIKIQTKTDPDFMLECMRLFEKTINNDCFERFNWDQQPSVTELFASANASGNDECLAYMNLGEYGSSKSKKSQEYLPEISQRIPERKIKGISLFSKEEKEELLRKRVSEKEDVKIERIRKELEKAKEDVRRFELEAERIAQEKRDAEKTKAQENEKKANEEGLSKLAEILDFKKGKAVVDNWLKRTKSETVSEDNHQDIYSFLVRCLQNASNSDKKEFNKPMNKSNIWLNVCKWVSKPIAETWYNELNK